MMDQPTLAGALIILYQPSHKNIHVKSFEARASVVNLLLQQYCAGALSVAYTKRHRLQHDGTTGPQSESDLGSMDQPCGVWRSVTPTWTGGKGSGEELRGFVVGGEGMATITETVRVV